MLRPMTEEEIKEAARQDKREEINAKIFIQAVKECIPLFVSIK